MRKLLFVTRESKNSKSIGLWKKNVYQMNFFSESGFKVEYFHLESHDNIYVNFLFKNAPIISPYKWDKLLQVKGDIDVMYIRYPMGDRKMIDVLRKLKYKFPNLKILIEIPTYPYIDELTNKKLSYFYIKKDNFAIKRLFKYVDRIVTFSNDQEIWNIPTFQVSNTIEFNKVKINNNPILNDHINLIAVATFGKWHGYDRVIEGLANYYSKPQKRIVLLHLVGTGNMLNKYKEIVHKYNLQNVVLFHGLKNGEELDEIYELADIALDSMGRHRSNVFFNSTLKGKEYGAKGLPIISGVGTELDNYPGYKFYLRVPADDTPIDIVHIIDFYDSIYKNRSKIEINKEIRKFNEEKFNVNDVWKNVVNYMKLP